MAQEILETLVISDDPSGDHRSSSTESINPSLSRNASSSRLNAGAPEFVPRAVPPPSIHASNRLNTHQPRLVKIHHGPSPPVVHHVFHPLPPSPQFAPPMSNHDLDYLGGGGGFREQNGVQVPVEPDPTPPTLEVLTDEVNRKITKQVEYYFSDANLATTEHLMRFISKDPEGYVPISVIACFKKIKALVHNNSLLADALRTSSKLVVSDDGKRVRRYQSFTESDAEELQSRMIVAENLPEDHCYPNLMKVFSVVGSVKTIRTCYPQTPNGTAAATNRSTKMDMLFGNKVHAFVEYETFEDAERAVAELNDERNWRSGLRVRLLLRCMAKHGPARGRKIGHEGDGNGGEDDDVSTANQPNEKQLEDPSQSPEAFEHIGEEGLNDKEGGARRGRGRGRGGRGRGRGQYQYNNNNNNNQYHNHHHRSGGHAIGTPPSSHPIHSEQPAVSKQPPGPRMPDGTRGFTMGRGKPLVSAITT